MKDALKVGTSVKRFVRPSMQFPLIKTMVYTGEPLNPWRCDNCLTKVQRTKVIKPVHDETPAGYPRPDLCRKCGVEA